MGVRSGRSEGGSVPGEVVSGWLERGQKVDSTGGMSPGPPHPRLQSLSLASLLTSPPHPLP